MKTTMHLCCLALSLFASGVGAFNLDTHSVTVVKTSTAAMPSSGSYFGYSHAFLRENNEDWLLVGAPKANVSWNVSLLQPGTVYKCRLSDQSLKDNLCEELSLDSEPVIQDDYTAHKYDQWLGGAMDVSSSRGDFVACGHRQMYTGLTGTEQDRTNLAGICFYRNATRNNAISKLSKGPIHDHSDRVAAAWHTDNRNFSKYIHRYPYSQWGTSVRLTTEGHVLMGAPGLWHWQGGILVHFDDNRNCSVENVTQADSYLGYSVTSIRLAANEGRDRFVLAGGAPRYMEAGAVYIVEIRTSKGLPRQNRTLTCESRTVLQEIISKHYGSYFGASILAEDTDGDGQDELFIGAPFQNLTLGDEGAVHYYARSRARNLFVESKILTGIRQGGDRFGTAIASIGDINFDGFKDVVIGSPFEDQGQGAIYIFNGSPTGIESSYSQRIAAKNHPQLGSLKSFGHSLSTGKDIDGNKYPDVSVGSYMSDSVTIIRARPVHNVSAEIWFPDGVISWQRPNCSKTSDEQSFEATLIVSFFYTIPAEEMSNIKDTYILVDHQNRSASLGPNQKIIFTDSQSSGRPIQFLVVSCRSEQNPTQRCVSFLVADRHATYLRLFDRNFYLDNAYASMHAETFQRAVSFRLSQDPAYEKVMTLSCLAMQDHLLVVDEHGNLTTRQMATGEQRPEARFRFTRGRYLPCVKDLPYQLNIVNDQRAFLRHPDGTPVLSRESISFTVENIDQPLNRTWKIMFPRYPKNIATPIEFLLNISDPSFSRDNRVSVQKASSNRIVFDGLLPVLSRRLQKIFTSQIGFKKECGDNDVCDAILSVSMTLPTMGQQSTGGGIVIGAKRQLELRFYIDNTGEAAYSVRLEFVHPALLPYSKVTLEDSCNQITCETSSVTPTPMESANSNSSLQGLNCDVENQIHPNGSAAFRIHLDTTQFREESDFPMDVMELQCRVGTHGYIRNGSKVLSFKIPIRFEAVLQTTASTTNDPVFNARAAELKSPDKDLKFDHTYTIDNKGPGIMPSVSIDVLLPDDLVYNVSTVIGVTVIVEGQGQKRVVNSTVLPESPVTATTVSSADNGTRPSARDGQNDGNAVKDFLTSAIAQDAKKSIFMNCPTVRCAAIRRYDIGSLNANDLATITIRVSVSEIALSNIKNLVKLNYTSYVLLHSPYNISEDVKTWRERKVKTVDKQLQTSTVFRPSPEPPTIPIWLILVGVGVGLLHVVAFVLILRKCGFFRRKQYEQLKDKMRESRVDHVMSEDAEAEQQEVASQYDNELLREQMSLKSQSQYSAAGSYGNGSHGGDETKKASSTVDALHAQHPGIDFTAE